MFKQFEFQTQTEFNKFFQFYGKNFLFHELIITLIEKSEITCKTSLKAYQQMLSECFFCYKIAVREFFYKNQEAENLVNINKKLLKKISDKLATFNKSFSSELFFYYFQNKPNVRDIYFSAKFDKKLFIECVDNSSLQECSNEFYIEFNNSILNHINNLFLQLQLNSLDFKYKVEKLYLEEFYS